ncbi:MAG: alcohol dehydrogenase catalytic domain-containing protein [bacterium]|nr:alcohol dehydrogenase catalytic domain-containing protein [bacterium]
MGAAATQNVVYLLGAERVEMRQEPVPDPDSCEILVKIDAATTCGTDLKVWRRGGHPRMLDAPCPFGHEMSGVVAAVGSSGTRWREGDRVTVANSASCGRCGPCRTGRENLCEDLRYLNGTFAEYILVPRRFVRRSVHAVPEGLDAAVAALAEPLGCVLHGLNRTPLDRPGEAVVVGAGPIGLMFVIELCRRGIEVVLGDPVVRRLEIGSQLGAAAVVELGCNTDDAERLRAACVGRRGSPVVIEATGVPGGWQTAMNTASTGGTVVLFGGCPEGSRVDLDTHWLHYSEITVKGIYHHRPASIAAALDRLAESEAAYRQLINEERPLAEVELALRRMAEHKILRAAIRPASDWVEGS